MPVWILYLLTTIATFFLMEGVAWFSHKYIMHGFLWSLHHDHHQRDDAGFFEKNDYFFLIFGIPGISLITWDVSWFWVYLLDWSGHILLWLCLFLCP